MTMEDRPPLRIDVTQHGDVTVVRPAGERLDLEVTGELRAVLLQLIKSGHKNLVMDLEDVLFIDSSGLGTLLSALKNLKMARERRKMLRPEASRRPVVRGDVKLARVQPPVATLLEIIRLHRVFMSYETVEEAVRSYSA